MASNLGSLYNFNMTGSGPGQAVADLGLGGDLMRQVQDETEEERKRRLRLMGGGTWTPQGSGSALGAVSALFGKGGAGGFSF